MPDAISQPRPQRTRRYVGPVYDSARWDAFRPRAGDIIVATPAKCGTTWTQMLCALLAHQTPELPLTRLSRWLDRHTDPIESLVAEFEAQPYRRIIETHTPLDGLPYFEQCAYVLCGRDPRDAFLSMLDHFANASEQTLADAARWPALVRAARFGAMKERAEETAPGAQLGEWKSASDFFRQDACRPDAKRAVRRASRSTSPRWGSATSRASGTGSRADARPRAQRSPAPDRTGAAPRNRSRVTGASARARAFARATR